MYSPDKNFYIKNSGLTNGCSGAPVFVFYNDLNNNAVVTLLGVVSKKIDANIVSIAPAVPLAQDYSKIIRLSQ